YTTLFRSNMVSRTPRRFKTIAEFYHYNEIPLPEHPLVGIIDYKTIKHFRDEDSGGMVFDFYAISLKRGAEKMFYGQRQYNFEQGVMCFMAPNQILRFEQIQSSRHNQKTSGWILCIHPDLLWNTHLAKTISRYEYFDYSVNEALVLSDKEEEMLMGIINNVRHEFTSNIDKFSKQIIISQLESLLNYSERLYNRQFITSEKVNHKILESVEEILNEYFKNDDQMSTGLPTVQYVADRLCVTPKYLSGLLKSLTGENTQQLIHKKLIEKAKEKLSTTDLSISEIAYQLGFEHLPSFSKLFKQKTNQSPLEFRT